MKNRIISASAVGLIVIGSLLRIYALDSESIRLDEAQSVWQASHSFRFILIYMVQNIHLPMHNTLLHLWMREFGTSEQALRLMAAIPGILTLPSLYWLANEVLGSRKKALVALALAALSPFWVWYSREIRMYTLLTLFSTLSYLFYVRTLKRASFSNFIGYFIVNLLGLYTHYFFGLVLFIQALFFLIAYKKTWYPQLNFHFKKVMAFFSLSAFLVGLFFAPWMIYFFSNHESGAMFAPDLEKPGSFSIILSFFEFTLGYQPEYITTAIIALWPLAVLAGFIFLNKRRNPLTPNIVLAFFGAVIPIVLMYTISLLYQPMYLTRYLISATPLFIIVLTWVITEARGATRYLFSGLFFILVMFSLHNQRFSLNNPKRENYKEAVEYVNRNAGPRDIVVVAPPYTLFPVYYYYKADSRITSMPIWDKRQVNIPQPTEERLENDATVLSEGHQRIFLITTLDLDGGYDVERYLDLNYTKLDKRQFSKFIWVEVYQAEYPIEGDIVADSEQQ
jgi:uncharacterized membrane protein